MSRDGNLESKNFIWVTVLSHFGHIGVTVLSLEKFLILGLVLLRMNMKNSYLCSCYYLSHVLSQMTEVNFTGVRSQIEYLKVHIYRDSELC